MKLLGWILVGFGVLLAASAFFTIVRAARGDKKGRRVQESIGCGFIMLAGFVWGYGFGLLLMDWSRGLRVGFGLAFLLSAVATAVRPTRGALMRGLVPLVLSALLLGPVLPELLDRFSGEEVQAWKTKLEQRAAKLDEKLSAAEQYAATLSREQSELEGKLDAHAGKTFEALSRDPEGLTRLRELAEVRELREATSERVAELRSSKERVESALRRVRRLSIAEDVLDMEISEAEIREILEESQQPLRTGVGTVEKHLETARLKELFEEEFGN